MFWGVILTIVGVSLIFETVFHIHLPIFRIAIAIFIIYLGIKMLVGPSRWDISSKTRVEGVTVFGQSTHSFKDGKSSVKYEDDDDEDEKSDKGEAGSAQNATRDNKGSTDNTMKDEKNADKRTDYSTVFGKSTIDFKGYVIGSASKRAEVNTVFGETVLELPENLPYKIEANTVMGDTRLPSGNASFMGQMNYKSPKYNPDQPYLLLQLNTVFGSVKIVTK